MPRGSPRLTGDAGDLFLPTSRLCSHQANNATAISSSDNSAAPWRSTGQSASFFSIPTVSITTPARLPSAAGTPNSSIARVNASSVPAASAGESIGSVTCQKARQALAPWTRATTASRVPLASRLRETAK